MPSRNLVPAHGHRALGSLDEVRDIRRKMYALAVGSVRSCTAAPAIVVPSTLPHGVSIMLIDALASLGGNAVIAMPTLRS